MIIQLHLCLNFDSPFGSDNLISSATVKIRNEEPTPELNATYARFASLYNRFAGLSDNDGELTCTLSITGRDGEAAPRSLHFFDTIFGEVDGKFPRFAPSVWSELSPVCDDCLTAGHLQRNCPDRKAETDPTYHEEFPPHMGQSMLDALYPGVRVLTSDNVPGKYAGLCLRCCSLHTGDTPAEVFTITSDNCGNCSDMTGSILENYRGNNWATYSTRHGFEEDHYREMTPQEVLDREA